MIVSLPASPWFYRCLHGLLIVVLAWLTAGLIWQLFAPRSPAPVAAPSAIVAPVASLDMSALNALFSEQSEQAVSLSSLGLKLRGVIATVSPAAAIFERPGSPAMAVKTGEEVEGGVRLVEVNADHAILDNRGRRERIDLDAKPAAEGLTAYTAASAPPPLVAQGMPPPPPAPQNQVRPGRAVPIGPQGGGREGDVRTLSRQALAAGMQSLNVNDWTRGLNDAPGNAGVLVDNAAAQPLAGPLGLQSGDVLTSVNGTALQRAADISSLYSAFSRAKNVNIELLRNGTPMNLRFSIESQTAP